MRGLRLRRIDCMIMMDTFRCTMRLSLCQIVRWGVLSSLNQVSFCCLSFLGQGIDLIACMVDGGFEGIFGT